MIRLLVVDDDPEQGQSLARLIALSSIDAAVETACGGAAAIDKLRSGTVDVVLTDLQMPKPTGLDLVEWLFTHQPHVAVFAMTAYPDDAALQQLEEFGTVECLIKPLRISELTEKVTAALVGGPRGRLRNISLPALLQLVDMERETCTLILKAGAKSGHLYFRRGTLEDAKCADLRGDAAAVEMIAWSGVQVTVVSTCASHQSTVTKPAGFIIMEAMRLQDERERERRSAAEARAPVLAAGTSLVPDASISLSKFPAPPPSNAQAMAVIERHGGKVLFHSGHFDALERLAQVLATVFEAQDRTASSIGEAGRVEEMVFTAAQYWAVCRPLEYPAGTLGVSVFDPARGTVGMERVELNGLAAALSEWTRRKHGS